MKNFALLLTLAFAMGCAQGNCRSQTHSPTPDGPMAKATASGDNPATGNSERIKVFKYDGSLQCGMGKGLSPEEMAKELKDVKLFSFANKADGLMHIAQCGTPSGHANVFEIEKKDLPQAQKAGFKEWLWE